jgi:hypothetical protein
MPPLSTWQQSLCSKRYFSKAAFLFSQLSETAGRNSSGYRFQHSHDRFLQKTESLDDGFYARHWERDFAGIAGCGTPRRYQAQ